MSGRASWVQPPMLTIRSDRSIPATETTYTQSVVEGRTVDEYEVRLAGGTVRVEYGPDGGTVVSVRRRRYPAGTKVFKDGSLIATAS